MMFLLRSKAILTIARFDSALMRYAVLHPKNKRPEVNVEKRQLFSDIRECKSDQTMEAFLAQCRRIMRAAGLADWKVTKGWWGRKITTLISEKTETGGHVGIDEKTVWETLKETGKYYFSDQYAGIDIDFQFQQYVFIEVNTCYSPEQFWKLYQTDFDPGKLMIKKQEAISNGKI